VRHELGPVTAYPREVCTPVAGGAAIVIRVGGVLHAFRNRCLHQDSPLDGGWVRDGVLTCPAHFWRYRVDDGTLVGSTASLESIPVVVEDGLASITLDDPPASPPNLRETLLARARTYDRDEAWRRATAQGEPG
jgi:nitrite reductase/ring-hydroxylating ferredoxin subunit